jgi:hypothetical protein
MAGRANVVLDKVWGAIVALHLVAFGGGCDRGSASGGAGDAMADGPGEARAAGADASSDVRAVAAVPDGGTDGAADGPAAASPCQGLVQTLAATVDGVVLSPITIPTGGQPDPETTNGGASFDLNGVSSAGTLSRQIFVGAASLTVGRHQAATDQLHLLYRVYDQSTTPYRLVTVLMPPVSGVIDVKAVARNPGERVCGTFELTATGEHKVTMSGTFNQVLPPPRPGSRL